LVASTIKAASLLAAGRAAGVVSAKVAALTEGVVKAMFATKIKSMFAVGLLVGLSLVGIGAGVGPLANPVAVAQQPAEKSGRLPVPSIFDDLLRDRKVLVTPDDGKKPGTKEKPKADDKTLLDGEIKRDLNRGIVIQVKLVELDTKWLVMTAEVVSTRDIAARGNGPNPRPLRLTNLPMAGNVKVSDGKKELKLSDMKAGSILRLQLESLKEDGEEMFVTGIRVEAGPEPKPDEVKPKKQ
jgi:hypothetical protein